MADSLLTQIQAEVPEYSSLSPDAVGYDLYRQLAEPHGIDINTFYNEVLGEKPPGFREEFGKSFIRSMEELGVNMTKGAGAAGLSLADKALEKVTGQDWALDKEAANLAAQVAVDLSDIEKNYPKFSPSYKDVDDFQTAKQYVGATMGQGLGSNLEVLIPGLFTGGALAIGSAAVRMAFKGGMKAAARKMGKDLGEEVLEQQIKKGSFGRAFKLGTAAGTYGAATGAETGSTFMGLLNEGEDAPGVAIAAGALKGALEVLPEFMAFNRIFKTPAAQKAFSDAVTSNIFKKFGMNVVSETTKIGIGEGITEAMQESIDIAAVDFVKERETDLFTPQNVDRLIEAGLAGFIGAGPMGVIAGGVQTIKPTATDLDTVAATFDHESITEVIENPEQELSTADLETIAAPIDEAPFDSSTAELGNTFQDAVGLEGDTFDVTPKELTQDAFNNMQTRMESILETNVDLENIASKVRKDDLNTPEAPYYDPQLVSLEPTTLEGEITLEGSPAASFEPIVQVEEQATSEEKVLTPNLPKDLANAKPRYKGLPTSFENDIAKALYITGKRNGDLSAKDQQYVDWLAERGIENPSQYYKEIIEDLKAQEAKQEDSADVPKVQVRMPSALKDVELQRSPSRYDSAPMRIKERDPSLFDEVDLNLSALNLARLPKNVDNKLVASITKRVKGIVGDNVVTKFFDDIRVTNERGRFDETVRGAQVGNVIYVSLGLNDALGYSSYETAFHEAFHYMYNNVLTATEKKSLNSQRPALTSYINKKTDIYEGDMRFFDDEEVAATAFGLYADEYINHKAPNIGPVKKVFNKIMRFLKGIRDGLLRNGVREWNDLFDDIAAGDRARDAVEIINNDERVVRLQRVVRKAHDNMHDLDLETPQRRFIKTEEVREILGEAKNNPAAEEWSHMQNFVNSWMNTGPGLATKDPLWAPIWSLLYSQQQNLNILDNTIVNQINELLENRARLVNAAGVLDHLNSNDLAIREAENGQLLYEKDRKLLRLNPQASADVKSLDAAFKTILKLWGSTIKEKLREIEGFDSIDAAIEAQQEIIDEFSAESSPAYRDKVVRATKRKEELLDTKETMKFIQNKIRSKVPYFPRMAMGEYGMKVTKRGDPKAKVPQGFAVIRANMAGTGPSAQEIANVKQRWAEMGYNSKEYKIEQPFRLSRNKLNQVLQDTDTQYNLELLGMLMTSTTPELAAEIEVAMNDLGGDLTKTHIQRSFLERNDLLLYSKDYSAIIPAYFSSATKTINTFRYADVNAATKNFVKSGFMQTPKGRVELDPKRAKLFDDLFTYYTSPAGDRANMRAFNFFWAMGANFSSAALQLVTLNTFVVGEMNTYGGNPLSNNAVVVKNFKNATNMLLGAKGNIDRLGSLKFIKRYIKDDKMARAIKVAHDRGEFRPSRSEDMLGVDTYSSGKVGSGYPNWMKKSAKTWLGKPVQLAEETSRLTAFMSFYETLQSPQALRNYDRAKAGNFRYQSVKKNNSDVDPAIYSALFSIDDTHGIFGKIGRGKNQQGLLGALVFPFMQHPLMMTELLVRMVKSGQIGIGPATYIIMAMTLLAGLYGIPGWELWKESAEELYKLAKGREIDIHHEIKKALITSEFATPQMAEALTEGALKPFLGIDVARRVQIPFFFQDALIPFIQGKDNIDNFTGVAGSYIRGATQNMQRLSTGEIGPAEALLESLAPVAFKNMVRAAAVYPTRGVRTGRGMQIMTPDELGPTDLLKKALGFQPSSISREYEKRNAERLGAFGWRIGRNKIVSRIGNMMLDQISASEAGDKERVQELDLELKEEYENLATFAKSANIPLDKDFWRGIRKSVNNHIINSQAPDAILKEYKSVDYKELEDIYER